MLDVLRDIVREVSNATSLSEAVGLIVCRVKAAMLVDACYICLAEEDTGDYALMAADGLNPSAVGTVRLGRHEGLIGLVGERQEPVNLENAVRHPRFQYVPETGEERFHAFLGVPIIHYRKLLGVLVVQQQQHRLFNQDEIAFLTTIAAQLAGAIQHAITTGGIKSLLKGDTQEQYVLQGIWGAPGTATGTLVSVSAYSNLEAIPDRRIHDIKAEEIRFRTALTMVQERLQACGRHVSSWLSQEAQALFDVYVMLLSSEELTNSVLRRIRAGNWAAGALRGAIMEHAQVFEQMQDPYLRARAEDIRDVGQRILTALQSGPDEPREYPERCILFGKEVSIAQIAEVPIQHLAGIISMRGSGLSHSAILARALGVPAVMGVDDLPLVQLSGRLAAVDGYAGRVFIQPSRAMLDEFEQVAEADKALSTELHRLHGLPAETPDGVRIALYVNTGLCADIQSSLESGAEGVGLHRTEFSFMVRQSFPGEDEQYALYRRLLEAFAPRPVILRTLDVGGDKPLPYLTVQEENPYLGWRGIRFTLDHPEIFRTQLRAMLRANYMLGNLKILLPMVTRMAEVDEAIALLASEQAKLAEEGIPTTRPPIGVMIEVPAIAYQLPALAQRIDFFSIGTNDLTQCALAVDRNNAHVSYLYDNVHPGMIRLVMEIIHRAQQCSVPIGVCGEMAGDPAAAVLLLAMGVDHLSMAAPNLLRVKWMIRSIAYRQAQWVLNQALEMAEAADVRRLLREVLKEAGLERLARTGV